MTAKKWHFANYGNCICFTVKNTVWKFSNYLGLDSRRSQLVLLAVYRSSVYTRYNTPSCCLMMTFVSHTYFYFFTYTNWMSTPGKTLVLSLYRSPCSCLTAVCLWGNNCTRGWNFSDICFFGWCQNYSNLWFCSDICFVSNGSNFTSMSYSMNFWRFLLHVLLFSI